MYANLKSAILFFLCLFVVACSNNSGSTGDNSLSKDENDKTVQSVPESQPMAAPPPIKVFTKLHDAGSYTFTVTAANGELSKVKLSTKGLATEFSSDLEIEGQVTGSYMTDINKDGYKEFILTIAPTDDSGNVVLMAYVSNKGKSISVAYVADPLEPRDVNTDKVVVESNRITRTYQAGGKTHTFTYELEAGEAGYQLVAKAQ